MKSLAGKQGCFTRRTLLAQYRTPGTHSPHGEPRPSRNALIMVLDQNRWVSPKRISKVLMFNLSPTSSAGALSAWRNINHYLADPSGISPTPPKKKPPRLARPSLTPNRPPLPRPPSSRRPRLLSQFFRGCGVRSGLERSRPSEAGTVPRLSVSRSQSLLL